MHLSQRGRKWFLALIAFKTLASHADPRVEGLQ